MRRRLLSDALCSLLGKSLMKVETMALICSSKLFSEVSSDYMILINRMKYIEPFWIYILLMNTMLIIKNH